VGGDGLLAILFNGNVQGEEVRLATGSLDGLFGVLSVRLLLGKIDERNVCTFPPARRRRDQPTLKFCGAQISKLDSRHEDRDRSADARITTSDQDGLVLQQAPALVLLQVRLLAGVVKVLELGPVGSGLESISIQDKTTEYVRRTFMLDSRPFDPVCDWASIFHSKAVTGSGMMRVLVERYDGVMCRIAQGCRKRKRKRERHDGLEVWKEVQLRHCCMSEPLGAGKKAAVAGVGHICQCASGHMRVLLESCDCPSWLAPRMPY